jgi:hypothetical protein
VVDVRMGQQHRIDQFGLHPQGAQLRNLSCL